MVSIISSNKMLFFSKVFCKVSLFALTRCWEENCGFPQFNKVHDSSVSSSGDYCFSLVKFFFFFVTSEECVDFNIIVFVMKIVVFGFGISEDKDFSSREGF